MTPASGRIVTRGGKRAPLIQPSAATLALIESIRPAFKKLCSGETGGRPGGATKRRDGTSRHIKRVVPAKRREP